MIYDGIWDCRFTLAITGYFALDREINAEMESEIIGIGIAVCFTLAMIYDGVWDCRFTLAITAYFFYGIGICRCTWHL